MMAKHPDIDSLVVDPRKYLEMRAGLENIEQCRNFPKYFEIETVRSCNADCVFCTKREWHDLGRTIIDEQLFDTVAGELGRHRDWIERVCLSRNGEPLLDPDLSRRVRRLKALGINNVCFSTNGQLLDEEVAVDLIRSGLDFVMFSVDGTTAATFEKIRRNLDFETVRRNILKFLAIRDRLNSKVKVRIRFVEIRENHSERADFLAYWEQHVRPGDEVYIMGIHSWANQKFKENADKVARMSMVPCISPFTTMAVLVNGLIPLCATDYNGVVPLGDLRYQTIKEVWQGEESERIRAMHLAGTRNVLPLCRGCDIWNRSYQGISQR